MKEYTPIDWEEGERTIRVPRLFGILGSGRERIVYQRSAIRRETISLGDGKEFLAVEYAEKTFPFVGGKHKGSDRHYTEIPGIVVSAQVVPINAYCTTTRTLVEPVPVDAQVDLEKKVRNVGFSGDVLFWSV